MSALKNTLNALFAVLASIVTLPALADLPSGYRRLDYVDTDGNQWVNTLFRPTCTNAVEIKAGVSRSSATQFLYCSRRYNDSDGRRYYSLCIPTGKARFDYQNKVASLYTFENGDNSAHVFFSSPSEDAGQEGVAEKSKSWTLNAFVDGVSVGSVAGKYFTPDSKAYFCLFGAYRADSGSSAAVLGDNTEISNMSTCRFYYFKVWDTKDKDNLLCHIVPVYGEAEQAAGLYDLVAERFLPVHGNPFVGTTLTLSADEDWSYNGSTIGGGITVDLNGNDLTVGTVATNTTSAFAGSDYQDLAYVLANGKQAVQITDFKLPGNAKVETMIRPSVISGTQWLFCSRTGAKDKTYSALLGAAGNMRFDFNNAQTKGEKVLVAGSEYELVFDGTTATPTWHVNGAQEKTHTATSNDFTGGGDLFLFGSSLSGTFSGRLYYFTVTANNVIVLDLRPVRRLADGVVGLYDTVNSNFYPSGTTTAFPPIGTTPVFANSSNDASALNLLSREIIPGYTVVDKITSSANAFIKTEYVPAATDCLELKASLSAVSTTYGLFCSRKARTEEMFAALFTTDGIRFDFNNGKGGQKNSKFIPEENEVFTVALDGNEKACYTNGALAATFTSNDFTPTATVYLFALHENNGNSSSRAPGSIYWFKVRGADGKLKVDMVPVVRDSDNKSGLYDRVRRKFYPSSQAEQFIAGEQVGDGAFTATEIASNITLVKEGAGSFDGGGTTLAGALRPVAGTVGGVTLLDGATLDVSDISGAFSLDDNAIAFADGARITIALGSRTVSTTSPLVSWTTPPANLGTLKFVPAAGASRGFTVKPDGIYLAPVGLIISFF